MIVDGYELPYPPLAHLRTVLGDAVVDNIGAEACILSRRYPSAEELMALAESLRLLAEVEAHAQQQAAEEDIARD